MELSIIDTIVTISSTGIATPGLEARALNEMGFRQDVKRVPVFGLGCAGGTSGLGMAMRLAQAEPGSNVLIVVVELWAIAWIQNRYMDTPFFRAALQIVLGGALVLAAGILIGNG